MFDFTIRLYNYEKERTSTLEDINNITISNITLVSKPYKVGKVCLHKGNQKKFGYRIKIKGKFFYSAGSHSSPILSFKENYIDIEVTNFPRFPMLSQDYYAAKAYLNGHGYTNYLNNGFPIYLMYRKLEILNLELCKK
jgi:hypothetical protein